ncbi:hypothetical protein RO575_02600 [Methylomonas sp. MO1]|uniref:hypothetical protein n=1 Tax=Methylomonas sp. MO1 TaxID=3073619 RepID=UPI0028A332D0|nr:hypothetical protein [Methylomonas sp. MO1]MDT4288439.1 hypothetical protein [Methylomonas sp. MO1]
MYTLSNLSKITALLLVVTSFSTQASTWRAISALEINIGGDDDGGGAAAVSEYSFGGSYFSDGQFNSSEYQKILVNSSGGGSYSFNNWFSYMNAPQVDITNMRVDFSALVFTGWYSNGTPAIGWEVGSSNWIPIIDNGNSTYTASWITPAASNLANPGGYSLSITFAPVPLPASLFLFASGFITLMSKAKFTAIRNKLICSNQSMLT